MIEFIQQVIVKRLFLQRKRGLRSMKAGSDNKKAERTKKIRQKADKAKTGNAKKDKIEVPFFSSIRFRLIGSFLIPVICIIILGVASYRKTSEAIIDSYKKSSEQTIDMMQQYISLIITNQKNNFKNNLNSQEMISYARQIGDDKTLRSLKTTFEDMIHSRMMMDEAIGNIYFLLDEDRSITNPGLAAPPEDAVTVYRGTAQGEEVLTDAMNWHTYGQSPETDAALNIDSSSYAIRIARALPNKTQGVMLINIKAATIRDALQSLDPGENGCVALIGQDGSEFYSDPEFVPEGRLIYDTEFFRNIADSQESIGNQMVTLSGKSYLFVYSKLEADASTIVALIPSGVLLAETKDIERLSIVLTVVSALIAMVLGTLISGSMSATIQYILRQLRKVSKGDLTVHLTAKSKNEFGLLCDGVNNTVAHVRDLITSVTEVGVQLNEAAADVSRASETFMTTSHDIQKAVSEISSGVNELDAGSENCLGQMDLLSGKIANVSHNAGEIERLASSTGDTIRTGMESVQGLTESAASTTEITDRVIESIEVLAGKSASIKEIVSAIDEIAEQTNLLSLNASIEAARAGEAGRGFSVVAEEIRRLSDESSSSAGQIASIINEIVQKTGEVAAIAKQAKETVSGQSGAVDQTTESFRQIDQQVEALLGSLATISSNVQEMNTSRSHTLEAIEGISSVSAQTASHSSAVYTTADMQLNAVLELEKESQQLRQKSDQLVEILSTFQVS